MENIIVDYVTKLEEEKTIRAVKRAMKHGAQPRDILHYMQEGMNKVGELFEREEYFLGDLIMAGIIFKEVLKLEELQSITIKEQADYKGRILIGTVENDIHDIGKGIFIGMAVVEGFHVLDLGVDVGADTFVEKIKEYKPHILGLSGLLSSASDTMLAIIQRLVEEGIRDQVKILAGGGILHENQATESVYADAYVKDAELGLQYCIRWMEEGK